MQLEAQDLEVIYLLLFFFVGVGRWNEEKAGLKSFWEQWQIYLQSSTVNLIEMDHNPFKNAIILLFCIYGIFFQNGQRYQIDYVDLKVNGKLTLSAAKLHMEFLKVTVPYWLEL